MIPHAVHATSIRMAAETKAALMEVVDFFSKDPDFAKLKMVNVFRFALYVLSDMDEAELKNVNRSIQIKGKSTESTPLRIPGRFYTERVKPLVERYANALSERNGVNVSQLTVKGIHYLKKKMLEDQDGFSALIHEIKRKQFRDNYGLC